MIPSDLIRSSLHNLLLHKVRSLLTSLGVIFGVGSVIAMLAVSEGAKQEALSQIEAMGIDKIIVYAKKPPPDSSSEGSSQASVMEQYGLSDRDKQHLKQMDNVAAVSSLYNTRKKIRKGTKLTDLMLAGADLEFLNATSGKIIQGRYFTRSDFANRLPVCIIGKNVKRQLFDLGATNIVGGTLHIEDAVFRVIGIVDDEYSTQYPMLGGLNNMIIIPLTTSRARYHDYGIYPEGRNHRIARVDNDIFIVRVADTAYIDNTSKRIHSYLENTHGTVKDWGMVVPYELLKQRESTQNIFTIVMGSIAGISLVVGGIGIMNIMLASVYERRKEIGTRRALGAQKSDILMQFLLETVFLTAMGGAIGVLAGIGIAGAITAYSGMPTVLSLWSILISLALACLVGIVFGTYPAYQAAQQNPIKVLRAE